MSLPRLDDLSSYLTDEAVADLVTLLLASRTSEEIAQLARRHGWEPIIAAARAAKNEFRRDYNYDVVISLHADPRYYEVTTTLTLKRALPPTEQYYVRFGRTAKAVRERLTDDAMLGAELVPVPLGEWDINDVRSSLSASVMVDKNGPPITAKSSQIDGADAVHLPIDLPGDLLGKVHHVQVTAGYVVPRGVTYFPVKLANVYCLGETTISLRINDPEVEDLDAWVSLPGDMGLDPKRDGVKTEDPKTSGPSHGRARP